MLETLPGKAWVNNTKIKLAIQNRPQKRDTTAKAEAAFRYSPVISKVLL